MRRIATTMMVAALASGVGQLLANQLLLPFDTGTSTLRITMRITTSLGTATSSDTAPISGFFVLNVETNGAPTQVAQRHFDIHATENLQFTHTFAFIVKLYTTLSGIQVFDAFPGPHEPSVPLTGSRFYPTNVWFLVRGTANYSGISTGTIILEPGSPQPLTSATNTLQTANSTNSLHSDFTFAFDEMVATNELGEVKINIWGSGAADAKALSSALPPPVPVLGIGLLPQTNQVALRWPSSLWPTPAATNTPAGYWLYRTDSLEPGAIWEPEPVGMQDVGLESTVDTPTDAAQRFYRLEWR